MNYYQYKRRVPEGKKGQRNQKNLKPFLLIIAILLGLFLIWKLFSVIFSGDDSQETEGEKVVVEVLSGSGKIFTAGGEGWEDVPGAISAYQGEKVGTLADGRLALEYTDGSIIRLDKNSSVSIEKLNENGATVQTDLILEEGKAWVNGTNLSEISVASTNIVAHTSEGIFAMDFPDKLYVIQGSVEADVMNGDEVLKTVSLGVGQQLTVSQNSIDRLAEGEEASLLSAVDEQFTASDWYTWNGQKDGISTSSNSSGNDSNESDGEDNEDEEGGEVDSENGAPQISNPGSNGSEVTLDSTSQIISGTVSEGTARVLVNDYELQKFSLGDTTFEYTASIDYDSLDLGTNTYDVVAFDEEGNKSTATITLILPQSVYDEVDTEEEEEEEASTGTVAFTSPNGGQDGTISGDSVSIGGTVPTGANTVIVNGYQLSGFQAGNSSFNYNANKVLGNLKVGQNTYEVEVYDINGGLLGSDTINITVEEGEAETPEEVETENTTPLSLSLSTPNSSGSHTTTFNQATIGGSTSSSVEAVFVNGESLAGFTPGQWSKQVELVEGENTFTVYGTGANGQTGDSSITITYQP